MCCTVKIYGWLGRAGVYDSLSFEGQNKFCQCACVYTLSGFANRKSLRQHFHGLFFPCVVKSHLSIICC